MDRPQTTNHRLTTLLNVCILSITKHLRNYGTMNISFISGQKYKISSAYLSHCLSLSLCTVQVLDNSPALKVGMEAYFDFLIAIDGVRLVSQPALVHIHTCIYITKQRLRLRFKVSHLSFKNIYIHVQGFC